MDHEEVDVVVVDDDKEEVDDETWARHLMSSVGAETTKVARPEMAPAV